MKNIAAKYKKGLGIALLSFCVALLYVFFLVSPINKAKANDAFVFNQDLQIGTNSQNVQELQKFLNADGFIVSNSGPGSVGQETTLFGFKTKASVILFQEANNLTPDGIVGPKTRDAFNKKNISVPESGNSVSSNNETYTLREIGPGGGIIFYVDPPNAKLLPAGITYLEAAPFDEISSESTGQAGAPLGSQTSEEQKILQSAGQQGISIPVEQGTSEEWSNIQDSLIGTTGTVLGSGQSNTISIVNQSYQQTGNPASVDGAALWCHNLVLGGRDENNKIVNYDDWFLPSKDELNMMYENLQSGMDENGVQYTPVGNFINTNTYWSSSEESATNAWLQYFSDGTQAYSNKSNPSYVRCVRAF